MKTFNHIKNIKKHLVKFVHNQLDFKKNCTTDNDGQIWILTDLYVWTDGTVRTVSEEEAKADTAEEIFEEFKFADDTNNPVNKETSNVIEVPPPPNTDPLPQVY